MDLGRQMRAVGYAACRRMIVEVQGKDIPDGPKLVLSPSISAGRGTSARTLRTSALPDHEATKAQTIDHEDTKTRRDERENVPGEILHVAGDIVINEGRDPVHVQVINKGDRPIQVGSHYHFAQTNRALEFDRSAAAGRRLDIPAGTAVRFEPGETKTVALVEIAGNRVARGGLL